MLAFPGAMRSRHLILALVLAASTLAVHARGAHAQAPGAAQPPAVPSAPVSPKGPRPQIFYGHHILALDALVLGAGLVSIRANSELGLIASVPVGYLVSGPMIHYLHGNTKGAWASVATRVLVSAAMGAAFVVAEEEGYVNVPLGSGYAFLLGAYLGTPVGALVDALAFGWKPAAPAPSSTAPAVALPNLMVGNGSLGLSLSGTF